MQHNNICNILINERLVFSLSIEKNTVPIGNNKYTDNNITVVSLKSYNSHSSTTKSVEVSTASEYKNHAIIIQAKSLNSHNLHMNLTPISSDCN